MRRSSFGLMLLLAVGAAVAPRAAWAAVAFVGPTNYSTGMQTPISVAAADFNGDLRSDLATASTSGASVMVRMNNGSGAFPISTNFTAFPGPADMAATDVSMDGRTDIVIAHAASGGVVNVTAHLGFGNGTFGAQITSTIASSGGGTTRFAVGDVNGDSRPDVVAANTGLSTIAVALGNGAGTFASAPNAGPSFGATDIALGDVNGDGRLDIASIAGGLARVQPGFGNGSFAPSSGWMAGSSPSSMQVADATGDGLGDLVVGNGVSGGTFAVTVVPSTGGSFATPVYNTAGLGTFGGAEVALDDLDADGFLDGSS